MLTIQNILKHTWICKEVRSRLDYVPSTYKHNIFWTALPVCLASLHCWLNPNDYKSIKSLSYLKKIKAIFINNWSESPLFMKALCLFRLIKNNDYMIVGANFLCMCFCKDFFINKISKFSLCWKNLSSGSRLSGKKVWLYFTLFSLVQWCIIAAL